MNHMYGLTLLLFTSARTTQDSDQRFIKPGGKCRFLSDVVVKACISLFFSSERGSLGVLDDTKHMFDPLRPRMIWLVCTMIHVAIKDYEHGTKKVVQFQGEAVNSLLFINSTFWAAADTLHEEIYRDIEKCWLDLKEGRLNLILNSLRGRINLEVGHELEQEEFDAEAIHNSSDDEDSVDEEFGATWKRSSPNVGSP